MGADNQFNDTSDQGVEDPAGRSHPEEGEASTTRRTAPPTRRKVTGLELEARFDGWRDAQRARRKVRATEDSARILRRRLSVIMSAGILALVVISAVTGNGFTAARSANDSTIMNLEEQISDARAGPVDLDLPRTMSELSHAAATDAGKVQAAQQTYTTLYHQSSMQPGTDNGAPNEAMVATAEHRKVLAPLFSKDSYLATDEDAYTWQNVLPFDAAREIDPRFAWYVRYDGWAASDPSTYTWKVETVMPDLASPEVSGATQEATVVWLCRDTTTSTVLAWASASYIHDGTRGLFDDLEVVVTAAGAAHQHPSSSAPDGSGVPELAGSNGETRVEEGGGR
ncbi:hypothetical protein L3Q67_26900 [Saccharothrix sp. AJ9571]|nr:hypothetical protein L3Q67_26900 [Saccharothrix sp. AJ9571]